MADYKISMDDPPSEADIRLLIRSLVSYNDTQVERENWQRLAAFIRNDQGEIVGGLIGYTHWGWLFISQLWVAELLRGQGYGTELVARAEHEAVKRGCQHAYVDTYDFHRRSAFIKSWVIKCLGLWRAFRRAIRDTFYKSAYANFMAPNE
ncbi:MAG: GNAT family N-acetyltransferase [Nitrococcus mobilis]|nr:GNAT family N-acetyltransferase [Nitrococcus mobilis]